MQGASGEKDVDVKAAVSTAKHWLNEVLDDEEISNVGLEEVKFDEQKHEWHITLGFSRPWNSARNALTAISGEPIAKRAYRIIAVDDSSAEVKSMTRPPEIVE